MEHVALFTACTKRAMAIRAYTYIYIYIYIYTFFEFSMKKRFNDIIISQEVLEIYASIASL